MPYAPALPESEQRRADVTHPENYIQIVKEVPITRCREHTRRASIHHKIRRTPTRNRWLLPNRNHHEHLRCPAFSTLFFVDSPSPPIQTTSSPPSLHYT